MRKSIIRILSIVISICMVFTATPIFTVSAETDKVSMLASEKTIYELFVESPMMEIGGGVCYLNWNSVNSAWGTAASQYKGYVIAKPAKSGSEFVLKAVVNNKVCNEIETALSMESGSFDIKFYASNDLVTQAPQVLKLHIQFMTKMA